MTPRRQQQPPPRPAARWLRRVFVRLLVLVALVGFFGAFVVVIRVGSRAGGGSSTGAAPSTASAAAAKRPAPARGQAKRAVARPTRAKRGRQRRPRPRPFVRLLAVAAYDPRGDGHENDALAGRASDGDATSYWTTEHYSSWGWKPGVGLVLDARRPLRLMRLTLLSDSPGFSAQIRAGRAPNGPFQRVSARRAVRGTTVFRLAERSPMRYRLVWITQLGPDPRSGGVVHLNEVRARSR